MKNRKNLLLSALGGVLLLLAGCEAVFTYSPVTFLQSPPGTLSAAQQLDYAQDALASGDPVAMKAAYDAIKNTTSPDVQYAAAQLGIELSGLPSLLMEIADGTVSFTDGLNGIDAFITAHGLDPSYVVAASTQLQTASTGVDLTVTDYAMGALGLLLSDADAKTGTWDITDPAVDPSAAITFFAPAVTLVASLPADDPMKAFIDGYNTYIGGL